MIETEFSEGLRADIMPDSPNVENSLAQRAYPGLVIVKSSPFYIYQRLAETLGKY